MHACCGVDKLGGRGVRVRFAQLKACQTMLRIPTPLHEQSKQHREGGSPVARSLTSGLPMRMIVLMT